MRMYLWLVFIIFGLMGVYIALLPIASWSDSKTAVASSGPF